MKILTFLLSLFISVSSFAGIHSANIPYPFYEVQEDSENIMIPIEYGEEALQRRLNLIRKAKSSIEVEYFIYAVDVATKIFTKELVKAAKRGVKVRILVDKIATELSSFYAHELKQNGVDIKYYNTSFLLRVNAVNYRNHRKLLVVDGKEAITGGRNMADEYFNLDKDFNFEDLDVLVRGPIVKAMKASFDAYFNDQLSHYVSRPMRPSLTSGPRNTGSSLAERSRWEKNVKKAIAFLNEDTDEERSVRERISKLAIKQMGQSTSYNCPTTTFSSDAPGANSTRGNTEQYYAQFRHLRKTILDKLAPIDRELIIGTPYFIANERTKSILTDLLERNVQVTLYTNSLRSTDQIFMATKLYLHLRDWLNKGMKVYLHDGYHSDLTREILEEGNNSRWGMHSKTHIYETSTYSEVMIGTYNVHNRSEHFNTELALFCKGNDQFTSDMKEMLLRQAKNGLKVQSMIRATDRNGQKINVTGASALKNIKMKLFTIPSIIFAHLL